mmetsp:Transcript_56426/g.123947  ORF Transcript_56426/g.123947 Transcript_56426/m.123947 type:complete len:194 (-) Transcript_56426:919-1500(-)
MGAPAEPAWTSQLVLVPKGDSATETDSAPTHGAWAWGLALKDRGSARFWPWHLAVEGQDSARFWPWRLAVQNQDSASFWPGRFAEDDDALTPAAVASHRGPVAPIRDPAALALLGSCPGPRRCPASSGASRRGFAQRRRMGDVRGEAAEAAEAAGAAEAAEAAAAQRTQSRLGTAQSRLGSAQGRLGAAQSRN